MAEADVRKCDWYGFSGFTVHRYCIWLSLPAPADSIRFQATCISWLCLPNATGDDAGLKNRSHTPPATALSGAASDLCQQKCREDHKQQKETWGDQTPFVILLSRWRTCKIWKNKHCWDIVLLHFSWCSPLSCLTELSAVCIFKQIGSDSVLIATAPSIGPIVECLSSFSLVFIGH